MKVMGITLILLVSVLMKVCLTSSSLHLTLLPTHLRMENPLLQGKLPVSQEVWEVIFRSMWRKKERRQPNERMTGEIRMGVKVCVLVGNHTPPLFPTSTYIWYEDF